MRKQINKTAKQAANKDARDYGIEANFFPADIMHRYAAWATFDAAETVLEKYLPNAPATIIGNQRGGACEYAILILDEHPIYPFGPWDTEIDDRFVTYGLLQAWMRCHGAEYIPADPLSIFPYDQAVQNGRV